MKSLLNAVFPRTGGYRTVGLRWYTMVGSAANRLELGSGVVVTFVEGLTPEMPGRVAYITHVASGSQAIVDSEGKVVQRHDGRADAQAAWIIVLSDGATVAIVMQRLTNGGDLSPRSHTILWVPVMQFGGINT